MRKRKYTKKKLRKNSLVYIRCRVCGRTFEGKSDTVLEIYSEHFAKCKRKENDKIGNPQSTILFNGKG
jgi:hypothetical protein